MIESTFGSRKPIIAMIHLAPLPGSPLYDRAGGMQKIVEDSARDIEALQEGGVDAVMFGNEGDRPYLLKASAESLAAMAFAVGALKPLIKVPFGVNYLWDPVATVGLAVASGARFAREIFTGVYDSDMGLWQPDAAAALRLRADCGRADLKLMFNINAEFAAPVGARPIAARAKSAVFSSARRRHPGVGTDDRRGGRGRQPHGREGRPAGHAGLRQHRRQSRQCRRHPAGRRRRGHRHAFQG